MLQNSSFSLHTRQAMWLLAGLGTRLRPFTEEIPKPMVPLWGRSMIEWTAESLKQVPRIIYNRHWLPEKLEQEMKRVRAQLDRSEADQKFLLSDESPQLLGSAGGIRGAIALKDQGLLPGTFFWINGDTWGNWNLLALDQFHHQRGNSFCSISLGLLRAPAGAKYRRFRVEADDVVVEDPNGEWFFPGIGIFDTAFFENLPLAVPMDLYPAVLKDALARKAVRGWMVEPVPGASEISFFDIGTPTELLRAHQQLAQQATLQSSALPRWICHRNTWIQAPETVLPTLIQLSEQQASDQPQFWYWDTRFRLPAVSNDQREGDRCLLYLRGHWVTASGSVVSAL